MDEVPFFCRIALALDGAITLCFSIQYIIARRLYNTYAATLKEGVNTITVSKVNKNAPTYAVVRGQVKAIGPPIKSLNKPSITGVIQDLTIKEHATHQSSYGIWHNRENIIDRKCNVIPFELRDGKFKAVITSPMKAHYLNLEIINDHFEPSVGSILGLLFGVQQKGFQYSEYLLREDAILTGFGEIIIENNTNLQMQLVPPRNGVHYILTTMDPETLYDQLKSEKKIFGICSSIFGIIGIVLAGFLFYKWWNAQRLQRQMKKLEIQAQLEKRKNVYKNELNSDSFICIICCVRPREVILLPCGHISMCLHCSNQNLQRLCPVCRRKVSNINLIFIS